MTSRVFSDLAANEVAAAYVADRYPAVAVGETTVVRLKSAWLVEVEMWQNGGDGPLDRTVLLLNRHGFVEELSKAPTTPPRMGACLEGLREVNEVIDLR